MVDDGQDDSFSGSGGDAITDETVTAGVGGRDTPPKPSENAEQPAASTRESTASPREVAAKADDAKGAHAATEVQGCSGCVSGGDAATGGKAAKVPDEGDTREAIKANVGGRKNPPQPRHAREEERASRAPTAPSSESRDTCGLPGGHSPAKAGEVANPCASTEKDEEASAQKGKKEGEAATANEVGGVQSKQGVQPGGGDKKGGETSSAQERTSAGGSSALEQGKKMTIIIKGKSAHPVTVKNTRDGKKYFEKKKSGAKKQVDLNYALEVNCDWSHEELRDRVMERFSVEDKAKDSFDFSITIPARRRRTDKAHFRGFDRLASMHLKEGDEIIVRFHLLTKSEQQRQSSTRSPARVPRECFADKPPSGSGARAVLNAPSRKAGVGALKKTLKNAVSDTIERALAASRAEAAKLGAYEFTEQGGTDHEPDCRIFDVSFHGSVDRRARRIDKNVNVVSTSTRAWDELEKCIAIICNSRRFCKPSSRVSSANIASWDPGMFWSLVMRESKRTGLKAVDVDSALKSMFKCQNWEHIPRGGRTRARKRQLRHPQNQCRLVVPSSSNTKEVNALLLVPNDDPFENAAFAMELLGRKGLPNHADPLMQSLSEVQLRILHARILLTAWMNAQAPATTDEVCSDAALVVQLSSVVKWLFCHDDVDCSDMSEARVQADQAKKTLLESLTDQQSRKAPRGHMISGRISRPSPVDAMVVSIAKESENIEKLEHFLLVTQMTVKSLEKDLGQKQAENSLQDDKEDVLFWVRKNLAVILILHGICQLAVVLAPDDADKDELCFKLRGCLKKFKEASDCFYAMLIWARDLASSEEVVEGGGRDVDTMSFKVFRVVSMMLVTITATKQQVVLDDSNTENCVNKLTDGVGKELEEVNEEVDGLLSRDFDKVSRGSRGVSTRSSKFRDTTLGLFITGCSELLATVARWFDAVEYEEEEGAHVSKSKKAKVKANLRGVLV